VADFKAQRNDPCDAGNYQFINKSKFNVSNTWVINELNAVSSSSFSALLPSSNEKDTFHSVKLYIRNSFNCVDSTMQIIKVKPKMHIGFDNSSLIACEKGIVNFTNKSQSAVRYFWIFGDGGLSNEVNPTYVYNRYGTYKVMLFGYDKDGCVDSSDGSTFFKVLEKPKADFTFLPAMPKLPNAIVTFTSTPTINSTNVDNLTYEWNFGDASFPTQNKGVKHPVHTYTTAGNKEVTLTIWNQQCSDVVSKPLFVEDPKPEIDFSADTTQGCAALTVHFKNNTINAQSYRWVFGDGTPDSYEKEPTHVFKFAGKWDVTLIAIGTGGTSSKTVNYMITVLPRPDADFFTNKRFLNLPNAVFSMQNISNNAIKYNWYIYDSFNNVIDGSTLRDPSFNIQEVGQYSVKLIATNSYGCTDTMLKRNYIGTFKEGYVYVPNAFSPNNNGRNEGFKPSTFNVKSTAYSFKVFTRWGELVYETNDLDAEWDGTFNGEQCTQDVYVFTVNGQYINNDQFTFRGTLTLLR
jgi:gliding motility-associated-like protein